MAQKLLRNRAQCRDCGDIIESKHRHDFVRCHCNAIFIDGGLDYMRYGYTFSNQFKSLSEYEPENTECQQSARRQDVRDALYEKPTR